MRIWRNTSGCRLRLVTDSRRAGKLLLAKFLVNGKFGSLSQSTNSTLVKEAGNTTSAAKSYSFTSRSCRSEKGSKDEIRVLSLLEFRQPLMCKANVVRWLLDELKASTIPATFDSQFREAQSPSETSQNATTSRFRDRHSSLAVC